MRREDLDRLQALLERGLTAILLTSAAAVFIGALAIIVTMDAGSAGQGGLLPVTPPGAAP